MLRFESQAMSPLQLFMHRLLEQHCGGEINLVVDNAALTMERVAASPPLANGSGHSCSRWETQEPSPTRNVEKVAIVPGMTSPSFQLRPLGFVSKNSSPACPIRKLSPRVHPAMTTRGENITSTSRMTKSSKGVDRIAIIRPPLSPRKKTVETTSSPGNNKSPRATTSGRAQGLQPPVRVLMKPAPPPEELRNLVDEASSSSGDEETIAAEMPAGGLTRGLSQTLGTDLKEQAPICPTRRPSTQSCDLRGATLALNWGHAPTTSKHSDRMHHHIRAGREILVLPPTPEMRVDVVTLQTSVWDELGRHHSDRTHESPGCGPSCVERRR